MKKTILIALLAAIVTTVTAKDIQTIRLTTTPQMHCESCENRIKGNLRFERGIKKIETNIPKQTITITYDANKASAETFIKALAKLGYEARPVKEEKNEKK